MSFLNSSTTFSRFTVLEPVNQELIQQIPELLKKYAITDIDDTAEERAYGWTCFDDMLDTKWERNVIDKAHYICFSLRLDTRRIPPAVLKKHYRIALMKEELKLQELGRKFVPKERRAELKDLVKKTLLTRFLPIPAEFQVVWDIQASKLYFASSQQKMIDLFEEHFVLTFNLRIEKLSPYSLAMQILGEDVSAQLDSLQASTFV